MAYTPPGVEVVQIIEDAAVTVLSTDQDPVLLGAYFEVFTDEVADEPYNPLTGAGTQVIEWPGKKLTSIVDLAGVRKATAEPDAALMAAARFPMVVRLRDPQTQAIVDVDPITGIDAVSQSSFRLAAGLAASSRKIYVTEGTSAVPGKVYSQDGGFVAAGVKVGNAVRVTLNHVGATTVLIGTVIALTDSEISYSVEDEDPIADGDVHAGTASAVAVSGKLVDSTGGLNADVAVGDRVVMFPEELEVDDGNAVTAGSISSPTLSLVASDVGRKVTIGSAKPADGAVSGSNGITNGSNTLTGTGITAPMVGRVVKISGGSISLAPTYRRIVTAGAGTCTFSGAPIANATAMAFLIYGMVTRTIDEVEAPGQFAYSGASLADALQTTIPVILHKSVVRNVTLVDSDTTLTYSGGVLTSGTGFLGAVPYEVFRADVEFEVFPNFEVLVTFRAVDTTLVGGELIATPEAAEALGNTSEYNDVGFTLGLMLAEMGTRDRNILVIGVNPWGHLDVPTGYPEDSNELAAYQRITKVLASDYNSYYLAPQTTNPAVLSALESHVDAYSEPELKRERSMIRTVTLPKGKVESRTGRIEPGLDGGNKLIIDAGKGFIDAGIIPGNKVVITSPVDFAGSAYLSAAATDNDELALQGSNWPLTPVMSVANGDFSVAGRVTTVTANAWKDAKVGDYIVSGGQYRRVTGRISSTELAYSGGALTGTGATVAIIQSADVTYYVDPLSEIEQAEALYNAGKAIADRRIVQLWPDFVELVTGTDTAGLPVKKLVPSYVAAGIAAGQMAVLPVQNSLTGHTIGVLTGLANSNKYFEDAQLNRIAEGGNTILVQKVRNGPVTYRHLLSTDMSSIKTREFAFCKNVDNQAKVLRVSLEPFLNTPQGRKNISQAFLDSLMLPTQAVFDGFVASNQLVVGANGERPYEIISITQHPTLVDRVVIRVKGNVPIAANNLVYEFIV